MAAQLITDTPADGRSGSITVHHGALRDTTDGSAFGYLIPGAHTGAFADWPGSARITPDDLGPMFTFEIAQPRPLPTLWLMCGSPTCQPQSCGGWGSGLGFGVGGPVSG